MALSEKLGKLVDVIFSRKVVAGVKTAEGQTGGGGGSPAQSVSVEDQGEVVDLMRKPEDFDTKEEEHYDKIKVNLQDIKKEVKEKGVTASDSSDAPFDYLVSLMTNDTGMTVDRAIDETKKVFYTAEGAPTDVATALASIEDDIVKEESKSMVVEMEHAGVSFKPGPSRYIARIYARYQSGETDFSGVGIEPIDYIPSVED